MGPATEKWVELGRVSGVFGVHGWVRVFSSTQPRDGILAYPDWHIGREGEWSVRRLEAGHVHGKGIVAKLAGSDDRDSARDLMGKGIAVPRSELPPTAPGEYYWTDLIGLQVFADDGHDLGVVASLMETGANDVLVVNGERERLIPFVMDDVVRCVDLRSGRLVVDWDPEF